MTLVEVLIVVSILIILAAIAQPLIGAAKEAALISKTESNLRQVAMETNLYAADHDGTGKYCDSYCMGLPPMPSFERIKSQDLLRPPRAPHPMSPMAGQVYFALFADPYLDGQELKWRDYAIKFEDRAVLYCDPFNNPPNLPLTAGDFIVRRVIGSNVGLSLVRIRDKGGWAERLWWAEHQK